MDRPAKGRTKAWDDALVADGIPKSASAFRVISVIRSSKKPQFAGTAKICPDGHRDKLSPYLSEAKRKELPKNSYAKVLISPSKP